MADAIPNEINDYLDHFVPPRPAELQAMEAHARKTGFPIIGVATGQLCYLIARMIGARRIFEMGAGYGYSTAWFARAVKENGGGTVYHVVWDDQLSLQAQAHLSTLGLDDMVQYRVSEAIQALRETGGPFDLIFNDIDKEAYPDSLPVIADKLRAGGVLIVDNLLWHGEVFDPNNHTADTEGVREFTRRITTDPNWIASIVPIRDGVLVAYKK